MANKRKASNKAKNIYLLSGLIYCSNCGGKMAGHSITKKYKSGHISRIEYYTCMNKKNKRNNCNSKMIRADRLEKLVTDMFMDLLYTESNIDKLIESMKQLLRKNNNIDVDGLYKELINIESEITNLIKAISSGINSETMVDTINTLEVRKKGIKTQIKSEEIKVNANYNENELKEFLSRHKNFSHFEPLDKKRILSLFINKVMVGKDGVSIHLNLVDLEGVDIDRHGSPRPFKSILYYIQQEQKNIIHIDVETFNIITNTA